jgi:hypothetical protein
MSGDWHLPSIQLPPSRNTCSSQLHPISHAARLAHLLDAKDWAGAHHLLCARVGPQWFMRGDEDSNAKLAAALQKLVRCIRVSMRLAVHPSHCAAFPFPALPCPALPCPALPCPALPCPALPCPALPCPAPGPAPAPLTAPHSVTRSIYALWAQESAGGEIDAAVGQGSWEAGGGVYALFLLLSVSPEPFMCGEWAGGKRGGALCSMQG